VSGTARAYVLQQQAIEDSGISDEEFWAAQEPFLETAIETGDYPELARLPEDAFNIGGTDMLEFGVRALLDGVEAFIAARQAGN
jgi:hypothetical protein